MLFLDLLCHLNIVEHVERLRCGLESDDARDAWDRLAEAYWYPLYAFGRRKGKSPDDAQDLVQGFFGRLLEKDRLKAERAAKRAAKKAEGA